MLEEVYEDNLLGDPNDLERILEPENDEREQGSGGEDQEAQEAGQDGAQGEADETTTVKKRIVKRPQPKLNPERLTGPRGIIAIEEEFRDFKFYGKGHEKKDLDRVMKRLEHWAHRLFPRLQFDDCLEKIEKLGLKRPVVTYVKKIRMGLEVFESTPQLIDDNEDDHEINIPQIDEPAIDPFEELLGRHFQQTVPDELQTHVPDTAPLSQTVSSSQEQLVQLSQTPPISQSPGLTAEQRERMLKNRMLAEERRLARYKMKLELEKKSTEIETNTDNNNGSLEASIANESNILETNIVREKETSEIYMVTENEISETNLVLKNGTLGKNMIIESDTPQIDIANETVVPNTNMFIENEANMTNKNGRSRTNATSGSGTPQIDIANENGAPETNIVIENETPETYMANKTGTPETDMTNERDIPQIDTANENGTPDTNMNKENETPKTIVDSENRTLETNMANENGTPRDSSVDIERRETPMDVDEFPETTDIPNCSSNEASHNDEEHLQIIESISNISQENNSDKDLKTMEIPESTAQDTSTSTVSESTSDAMCQKPASKTKHLVIENEKQSEEWDYSIQEETNGESANLSTDTHTPLTSKVFKESCGDKNSSLQIEIQEKFSESSVAVVGQQVDSLINQHLSVNTSSIISNFNTSYPQRDAKNPENVNHNDVASASTESLLSSARLSDYKENAHLCERTLENISAANDTETNSHKLQEEQVCPSDLSKASDVQNEKDEEMEGVIKADNFLALKTIVQ